MPRRFISHPRRAASRTAGLWPPEKKIASQATDVPSANAIDAYHLPARARRGRCRPTAPAMLLVREPACDPRGGCSMPPLRAQHDTRRSRSSATARGRRRDVPRPITAIGSIAMFPAVAVRAVVHRDAVAVVEAGNVGQVIAHAGGDERHARTAPSRRPPAWPRTRRRGGRAR